MIATNTVWSLNDRAEIVHKSDPEADKAPAAPQLLAGVSDRTKASAVGVTEIIAVCPRQTSCAPATTPSATTRHNPHPLFCSVFRGIPLDLSLYIV